MGREVSFVLDRKEDVHVGREALLDVHDSSASAEKGDSAISSQKPSSSPLRDFLPTLKDAVKLALFCAVTVAGMTVISQVFPKPPWSNVCSSTLHIPAHLTLDAEAPFSS